jgi:type VI secretion system protein ImpE
MAPSPTQPLFQAGKLAEAITLATQEVKSQPLDHDRRAELAVLLCFAGNLERADLQLDALGRIDPEAEVGITLMRQLIRAETWRRQFHLEGRVPELLDTPDERLRLHLEASILLREEDLDGAQGLLERAEELRPHPVGFCDDVAIDDLRDLDDAIGGYLEVLSSTGKYFWIPMERVEEIVFTKIERRRDLLWRRVSMKVLDGPEGDVYLPTTYVVPVEDLDETLLLGRSTEWIGGEGEPMRGQGLRTFLVGDEARAILEIGELKLEPVVPK